MSTLIFGGRPSSLMLGWRAAEGIEGRARARKEGIGNENAVESLLACHVVDQIGHRWMGRSRSIEILSNLQVFSFGSA